MKWIVIILLAAGAFWVYNNVDFSQFKNDTTNSLKQEKNIEKFFDADNQNKEETQKVIRDF